MKNATKKAAKKAAKKAPAKKKSKLIRCQRGDKFKLSPPEIGGFFYAWRRIRRNRSTGWSCCPFQKQAASIAASSADRHAPISYRVLLLPRLKAASLPAIPTVRARIQPPRHI